MTHFPGIETTSQAIQDKIKALQSPTTLSRWQFKMVKNPETDQDRAASTWQDVPVPYSWSSADGEGWFKCEPHLSRQIEGIPVEGSRLEIEFMLPIGAGILVNGKELYREPSWTDTRAVRLVLDEHFSPENPFILEVHCNAADGLAQFLQPVLKLSRLSEVIFNLDLVSSQILFCGFLAEKGKLAGTQGSEILRKAIEALDLPALKVNQWEAWQASVEAFRKDLAPFEVEAKTYTAHLVGHSHIDMNWLWPEQETVEVCKRDFSTMTRLMDHYPEFHFSQSQAATYQFMETHYPELFERIRQKIAAGQWEVTASTWVEGDLNMAAGETLARQLLHARRYVWQHFGVKPRICWEPDTFGHSASLPQLLKKSGIDFYYFCRCGKGQNLFWWQGIDGSRLLAVQEPQWYLGTVTPSSVIKSVLSFANQNGTNRGMLVYGVGDHGGGATENDLQMARRIKGTPLMPDLLPSSSTSFYQEALAQAGEIPTIEGELNTTFEGCYTSHADIKRLNRACENTLLTGESVSALAAVLSGHPQNSLADAWRTLCFHQFHDILCGCAIKVTYQEAAQKLESLLSSTRQLAAQALQALSDRLDTGEGTGFRLVVFNPLAWKRTDLVRVPLHELDGVVPLALQDSAGRILPVQVAGQELIFVAEDLPALGIQIYRYCSNPSPTQKPGVKVDPEQVCMENNMIRVKVNTQTGELCRWEDLETGRELVPFSTPLQGETGLVAGFVNQLQLSWEEPHGMSAWIIGKITHTETLPENVRVKVIENGPVRAVIEVSRSFLNSHLTQRLMLYRGLRRIDFETEVDWHEKGSSHSDAPMLRVAFTPNLGETKATFEIPFAGLERPASGEEVPALRWIDLSEKVGSYGVALLNNCKYGHQVKDNTFSLTLVRASYEPDLNPDEGLHTFTYSLYPHPGSWEDAGVIQQAAGLNQPVLYEVSRGHRGSLQAGQPWLECSSEAIIISAVKLAEDQPAESQALIIRLYEGIGKAKRVSLSINLPFRKVEETDLIEQPLAELPFTKNKVLLHFTPHEIKTLKVTC